MVTKNKSGKQIMESSKQMILSLKKAIIIWEVT